MTAIDPIKLQIELLATKALKTLNAKTPEEEKTWNELIAKIEKELLYGSD